MKKDNYKDCIRRISMERIDLPMEEIIQKFESGIPPLDLAEEYNVSKATLSNRINKYYNSIDKRKPKILKDSTGKEFSIDELVTKYENGVNFENLAKQYNISIATIRTSIKNYYTTTGRKKTKILKSTVIITDYLSKGLTIEQIIELAAKNNIVIPQNLIEQALHKTKRKNFEDDDNEER